jgi:hypothetical protein
MFKIFALKDLRANVFKSPHLAPEADAIRSFGSICNEKEHELFRFAEDFALYCFGQFDELTGEIRLFDVPVLVDTAVQASKLHREYYAGLSLASSNN